MNGSAVERLDQALDRVRDPGGEGARACLTLYVEAARAAALAADARSRGGIALGPLDGVVISIKDLFDVAGEPTRAGSKILADAAPAPVDAPVVRRLRRAGAVIVAKTNMTEFAFSGIGTNDHFGTPGNPTDRARVPGGSSSGGAVAVADRMCAIAIGSDTGGSTRIPAALCGIVGFKPTKRRVPTDGAFPLSFTMDSVGPMAGSVAECHAADAIMAGEEWEALAPAELGGLRLGVPQGFLIDDLDGTVARRFESALTRLSAAGARVSDEVLRAFEGMLAINARGGFVPPEAYAIHREWLSGRADDYDPNVRHRMERGSKVSVADYILSAQERVALLRRMDESLARLDALILPTTPIVAPRIDEVASIDGFTRANALLLRNTAFANFFDLAAITLPLPRETGRLAAGLMLVARHGADRRLFQIAAAVEGLLAASA